MSFLLGLPIFRSYVKFSGCMSWESKGIPLFIRPCFLGGMGDGIGRVSLDSHEGLWENQGGLPQRFETLKLNESLRARHFFGFKTIIMFWVQLVYTPGNERLEPTAITHEKKGTWSEANLHDYVQNVNLQVGTMQSDCNRGGFNLSKVVSFTTRLPQIKPVAYFNLITIHGVHLWYVYLHFVRYLKFPSAPIPSTSGLGAVFSYLNTEPHSVEQ